MGGLLGQFSEGDTRNDELGAVNTRSNEVLKKISLYKSRVNEYLQKVRLLKTHSRSSVRLQAANLESKLRSQNTKLGQLLRNEMSKPVQGSGREDDRIARYEDHEEDGGRDSGMIRTRQMATFR